ncbi:MAG: peptidase M15 [Prevotella sp.]|nr:peptidase M15 [Prevotella sp.]
MKKKNFMLTPHFSYNEMTRSAWADRHGVDNTPDSLQLAALENLCRVLLEPLRAQFGPIYINSAFRSEKVNTGVHGVGCSKHLSGEAVDIHIENQETGRAYYRFILHHIDFDQLLFEHRRDGAMWLHCSVLLDSRENRHQAFPNYKV